MKREGLFYFMAKPKPNTIKPVLPKKEEQRPIEIYFNRLDASHQQPLNRTLHIISILLMIFSILGIAWAIPFPTLKFLGAYNSYFNWYSFVIAVAIYFYLKLTPLLSYIMLLVMFVLSYGVMQLAAWQALGGPALWMISLGLFILSWIGQYAGSKIEGNPQSFKDDLQLAFVTPLWAMYNIFKKIGLKY